MRSLKSLLLIIILSVVTSVRAADQEQYIYGGGLDHPIQHWAFPDPTTRDSTTGFFNQDVGKLGYLTNQPSYYYLANANGTWGFIGGFPLDYSGTGNFSILTNSYIAGNLEVTGNLQVDSLLVVGGTGGVNGQLVQSNGTGGVWSTDAAREPDLKMSRALGSVLLAWPINGGPMTITQSFSLTDGAAYYVEVYLPVAATVTGVKFYQSVQGVYTADNNNVVGLYTYSGGTMTQVAVSTNDGNLWKATSNTWTSKAFTSTYAAQPGSYFIGFIYNSSAQTTAPSIGGSTAVLSGVPTMDFTNSARFSAVVLTQTNLPASQAMSGVLTENNVKWLALY